MESPLRVTRTCRRTPYADLSAVALPCGIDNPDTGGDAVAAGESVLEIEFVKYRAAVVLYLVDSGLEPTREDIDTIEAISQATGRIAVGLVGPVGLRFGARQSPRQFQWGLLTSAWPATLRAPELEAAAAT